MTSIKIAKPLVLHIFLLSLISLFFANPKLVEADHDLMKLLCESTEVPALCMQCLESDPKSEKVDKYEIPGIIINCLSINSRDAKSNFTNLEPNITDKVIKGAVKDCIEKYSQMIDDLPKVNVYLEKKLYDNASDALSTALHAEEYCIGGLARFEKNIENLWIFYGMRVFEALSEAAMRIIDRLE